MKKQQVLARILLSFCVVAALQVGAATTMSYGCVFCGGGSVVIDDDPVVVDPGHCIFCGGGSSSSSSWDSGTDWSKATSKTAYIVDSDGEYAGIATITTSKKSNKGKVSVKIAFKMATGKKATAAKTAFTPDDDGNIVAKWTSVKNIGAVEVTLEPDGEISGMAGAYEFVDMYEDDDDDDGVFVHGEHTFSVDPDDYEMPNEDYDFVIETVPMDVAIVTSGNKSWDCGKAPSIKYKKVKEDGETWYELIGLDDDVKTNYSGLKLKYNAKNGTFSGSFKVYATNEGSIEKGKPKLKKYTFSVSGRISGSTGTGVATCKKLGASWEVTID